MTTRQIEAMGIKAIEVTSEVKKVYREDKLLAEKQAHTDAISKIDELLAQFK